MIRSKKEKVPVHLSQYLSSLSHSQPGKLVTALLVALYMIFIIS